MKLDLCHDGKIARIFAWTSNGQARRHPVVSYVTLIYISSGELLMRSWEGYFGVYFPSCAATREKHQITFVIINKADLRQYIPRSMHKIRALSCFILVRYWPGLPFNLTALPRLPMVRTATRKNMAWWRHQMETFSALLALCEGKPPVTGGFPSQRPATGSFNIFFHLRLTKRLSKQHGTWNMEKRGALLFFVVTWWRHQMETLSALLALSARNSPVNSPHKSQWRAALMFSLICASMNAWVSNREAGDLRRHRAHYDVIVIIRQILRSRMQFVRIIVAVPQM